jgi:hypothetical protein
MSEDDIIECECGSRTFTIARDGLIECSECRHPTADHIAYESKNIVAKWINRIGLKIVEPESYAH